MKIINDEIILQSLNNGLTYFNQIDNDCNESAKETWENQFELLKSLQQVNPLGCEVIASEQRSDLANGAVADIWSWEEFELSEETDITPAVYQFLLRKNKTKILQSDEYTRKDCSWAKEMREKLQMIITQLNSRQVTASL